MSKKQSQVIFSAQIYSLHSPGVTIDWAAITKSRTTDVPKLCIFILHNIGGWASRRATISTGSSCKPTQPHQNVPT
jgi:hypothetical protein